MKKIKTKKVLTIFLALVLLFSMTFGQTVFGQGLTSPESNDSKIKEVKLSYGKDLALPIEKNFTLDLSPLDEHKDDEKESEGEAVDPSYYVQIFRPEVLSLDEEKLTDQDYEIKKVDDPSDFREQRPDLGQVYKLEVSREGDHSKLEDLPFRVLGKVSDKDGIYVWKNSGEILGKYELDSGDFDVSIFEEKKSEIIPDVGKKEKEENKTEIKNPDFDEKVESQNLSPRLPQVITNLETDTNSNNNNKNIDEEKISIPKDTKGVPESNTSDSELNPVNIDGTITSVPDMVNTWQVNLKVKREFEPTVIYLLIDRSYSMSKEGSSRSYSMFEVTDPNEKNKHPEEDRMNAVKKAAKKIVDQLLSKDNQPADNLKIGIIDFGRVVKLSVPPTNNPKILKDCIDNLTAPKEENDADGGTFTQEAIKAAREALDKDEQDYQLKHPDKSLNKHVILLSDGVPTYSYEIKGITFDLFNKKEY